LTVIGNTNFNCEKTQDGFQRNRTNLFLIELYYWKWVCKSNISCSRHSSSL